MSGRKAQRIELGLDVGASSLLGSAVAFSAAKLAQPFALTLGAAAVAFLGCLALLRRVTAGDSVFRIPAFAAGLAVVGEPEELLLTDVDRLEPIAADDELVLDDVLVSLGEESRVVRLFDASAMPTPGQLKDRIDRHLTGERPPIRSPDASQALHEALAELRRSLR